MISITSKFDGIYIWHIRVQAFLKMLKTFLSFKMHVVLYYLYILKNKIYFYSNHPPPMDTE